MPPGYPPKRSRTGLIVVLVIAGVLVLGGLGVGGYFMFKPGEQRTPLAAPTAPAAPTGPPDKYTAMPACASIGGHVPNLPPLFRDAGPQNSSSSDPGVRLTELDCTWPSPGVEGGQVSLHLGTSVQPGSGAGQKYIQAEYDAEVHGYTVTSTPLTGVGHADQAAQLSYSTAGLTCGVRLRQGNIEAGVLVSAAPGDTDVARCQANARKLAEAVSAAIGG